MFIIIFVIITNVIIIIVIIFDATPPFGIHSATAWEIFSMSSNSLLRSFCWRFFQHTCNSSLIYLINILSSKLQPNQMHWIGKKARNFIKHFFLSSRLLLSLSRIVCLKIDQVYSLLFVCWFILVCYQNHQIHFKHPINCYATNSRDLNKARTPHVCNKMHTHACKAQANVYLYTNLMIKGNGFWKNAAKNPTTVHKRILSLGKMMCPTK